MTIRQYFLDDVEDNRHEYDMQDFSRFHALVFGGNGFSNKEDTDNMKYELTDNMNGKVGSGYVTYNGYVMEVTEPEHLEHDIADPDHARIDIVVARFKFDPEEAKFTVNILKGSPGSSPKKPSVTQNSSTYEIPIAEVKVNADESSLKDENVTDEREDNYLPIDNLQRGVVVDEYGSVSMPNQSYVEMNDRNADDFTGKNNNDIEDRENYNYDKVKINPSIDRQEEVKNNVFNPKANGTYITTIHIRMNNVVGDDEKLEAFFVINGKSSTSDRVYLFNQYGQDVQFNGTAIKYLEKGDEMEVYVGSLRLEKKDSDYIRLSIAKIN